MSGEILPHARELERGFIGGIVSLGRVPDGVELPAPDAMLFSDRATREALEVIVELIGAGLAVDVMTVSDALARKQGRTAAEVTAELCGWVLECGSVLSLESYLVMLRTVEAKRRVAQVLPRLNRIARGNSHTSPEQVVSAMLAEVEAVRSGVPMEEPERTYTAKELAGLTFPTEAYLLEAGLVPMSGLTLLAGDVGAGKSISSLDLSLTVSSGGGQAWHSRALGGAVLYLGADNSARELQRNLVKLAKGRGLELEVPLTVTLEGFALDREEGRARLERMIRARAPVLVVIDTLAHYSGESDLNDYSDVNRLLGGLRSIADRHGCALLVVHHLNKQGGPIARRLLDRVNGSVALVGAVNDVLAVTVESSAGQVTRTLTLAKGRDEPVPAISFIIESDPDGGLSLTYGRAEASAGERSLVDRLRGVILETLEQTPGRGYSRPELELIIAGLGLKHASRSMTAALGLVEAAAGVRKERQGRGVVYRWSPAVRLPFDEEGDG